MSQQLPLYEHFSGTPKQNFQRLDQRLLSLWVPGKKIPCQRPQRRGARWQERFLSEVSHGHRSKSKPWPNGLPPLWSLHFLQKMQASQVSDHLKPSEKKKKKTGKPLAKPLGCTIGQPLADLLSIPCILFCNETLLHPTRILHGRVGDFSVRGPADSSSWIDAKWLHRQGLYTPATSYDLHCQTLGLLDQQHPEIISASTRHWFQFRTCGLIDGLGYCHPGWRRS